MKNVKKFLTLTLVALLTFANIPIERITTAYAAETAQEVVTVITGGYGTIQKTLSSKESATVVVDDGCLSATVGTATYKFRSYLNIVGMAVVSDDDLLHIFTFSGKYYVVDLRLGAFTTIEVWRNSSSWKYESKSAESYEVFGSSIIDTKYFYERVSVNSVSRESLVTRVEFEKIANPKPDTPITEAPTTEAPTTEKPTTEAPTTEKPTTEAPTTENPTTEVPKDPTISEKIDINWWYQKYIDGTITWDQLLQILFQYNWTAKKEGTSTSTTYYFYDENGKLVKEETVTTGTETTNGNGNGSATIKDDGAATVKVTEKEKGEATVSVTKNVTVNNNTQSTSETYYHVKRKGNSVKLIRRKAKKSGTVCSVYFNKKKGVAKFDGITYKKIKYVGYTQGSRQIIMITKSNKVWIIPRAKGQIGKVYTKKVLSGKWKTAIEDNAGLAIRVSNKSSKVKGVINAQPKKLTK